MNKVNQIVVCKDNYSNIEDFENAVKRYIMQLLKDDYIIVVRYDEKGPGIVVIEFDSNSNFGNPIPVWLTPEQEETVIYTEKEKLCDSGINH